MRIEYREIGQYVRPVLVAEIDGKERVFSLEEIHPEFGYPCLRSEASLSTQDA